MDDFLTFYVEATPDGVSIMHRNNDGMTERVEIVPYTDTISHLDVEGYNDKPDEGMFIHLVIASGGNQGYFDYTSQHHAIMWCQLIATMLINEMRKESGTVSITDDSDNRPVVSVYSDDIVAMPLYPIAEHLAVASNIGDAMIEKYGVDVRTKNAITLYGNMFDVEQETLAPLGRKVPINLHSSFTTELNENGIPEAPITH